MKIIQINNSSSSFLVENYKSDIYRNWFAKVAFELKKQNTKLDIEAWTPEKEFKNEETSFEKGVKFRIFPSLVSIRHGMELSFSMFKALGEEIRLAEKQDEKLIIHFHEYHAWQIYLLLLLRKNNNVKIIAQHHGGRNPLSNLLKYKRLFLFLPVIVLMQFFENILFKRVDVFYALSDFEIDYLKKIAKSSEIKFQTMGIEEEYFKKSDKIKAKKTLGLKLNREYILYIGRIKTTKGIKELLEAMKEINAELLLMGQGQDSKKYEDYAKEIGLNNCRFLGQVYGTKKLDYLAACDCLILPSHTEGAPVVIMEAIAKNLPVVVSDVGGVRRMIQNKREGIIIQPKSKEEIKNALNQILKWKSKNISKYAQKYKWKEIIKETLKDYGIL